jgi:hypothetical protein
MAGVHEEQEDQYGGGAERGRMTGGRLPALALLRHVREFPESFHAFSAVELALGILFFIFRFCARTLTQVKEYGRIYNII